MPLIKLIWYITATSYLYTLFYIQRIQNKKTQEILYEVLDVSSSMKFSWLIQSVSSSCTTTTILLDGVPVSRRLGPFFCFIWFPQLPPHEACWSDNVAFVSLLHKSTVIWYESWHMTRGKNVTESCYIENSFSKVLNTSAVLQVQEYTLSFLSVDDVKMWPEMCHPHHSEAKQQQDVVYNEHQRQTCGGSCKWRWGRGGGGLKMDHQLSTFHIVIYVVREKWWLLQRLQNLAHEGHSNTAKSAKVSRQTDSSRQRCGG